MSRIIIINNTSLTNASAIHLVQKIVGELVDVDLYIGIHSFSQKDSRYYVVCSRSDNDTVTFKIVNN